MHVDWNTFSTEIDTILDSGVKETDRFLALKISSYTSMTESDVQELFPESFDKKQLAELVILVKSKSDQAEKIKKIISTPQKYVGVMITLLNKFI